jgi:hypothetical protein
MLLRNILWVIGVDLFTLAWKLQRGDPNGPRRSICVFSDKYMHPLGNPNGLLTVFWPEPTHFEPILGQICVEDGHHRYFVWPLRDDVPRQGLGMGRSISRGSGARKMGRPRSRQPHDALEAELLVTTDSL